MRSVAVLALGWPVVLDAQHALEHMETTTLAKASFDELEVVADGDLAWDADVWVGSDLRRLWLKTEGERSDTRFERSDLQLLYSRAILPFWDLQGGMRRELEPCRHRNWGVVAIRGTTPYRIDVEAELFIGQSGDTGLRIRSSYELLLTQHWVLEPELELAASGYANAEQGVDTGLGEVELALRLRYELERRELAPYIGMKWAQHEGGTRAAFRRLGFETRELAIVAGIRLWF